MFTSVEIVAAPATISTGFAGRTGVLYGWTTPSITEVDVVGGSPADEAVNISFDDGTSAWFEPSLVVQRG
jgi:hypothetical protein